MNLSDIKTYLNNRPFTKSPLPDDTELTKYMNFSILIIKTFYGLDDEFFEENDYAVTIVGEELAYLLDTDPTFDIAKYYNYLKSFTVANGAIKGEVWDKTIGFLGQFVKNIMKALGIDMIQQDSDAKAYYTYTIF